MLFAYDDYKKLHTKLVLAWSNIFDPLSSKDDAGGAFTIWKWNGSIFFVDGNFFAIGKK